MEQSKKKWIRRFFTDVMLGMIGLVAMNAVISIGINPFLNRQLGDDGQGEVLFFTAIMGLMASAVGSGLNYARMKESTIRKTQNGDYNWGLLAAAILSCVVVFIGFAVKKEAAGATIPGVMVLVIVTVIRYYADVEYRLHVNYVSFFLYYMLIAAGYLAGILLYPLTGSWVAIFLCGELAGLLFLAVRGTIFRRPFWKRSPAFAENVRTMVSLSAAYFLSDFVSYTDRLLLSLFVSDAASTHFYIATLVGKMTSLLSTPLNGVIIGHLSRFQGSITKKMFRLITLAVLGTGILLTFASTIGSWIFVSLIYPNQLETVQPLFLLANAGQVFFFLSNTMMVVILRFASERYQLLMGLVYAGLFAVIVVPAIVFFGVWGAAAGLFAVNFMKFILITALGFHALSQKQKKEGV